MEMFVARFCLQLIPESLTKKIDLTKPEIFLLLGPRFCIVLCHELLFHSYFPSSFRLNDIKITNPPTEPKNEIEDDNIR